MKAFTNCQVCIFGEFTQQDLYFDEETGLITPNYYYRTDGIEKIDLDGAVVAPGFLELQTNGLLGFHFTHFESKEKYQKELEKVSKHLVTRGVTGFWATVPTVSSETFQKVLS